MKCLEKAFHSSRRIKFFGVSESFAFCKNTRVFEMMKLSISRCSVCSKIRLVDKIKERNLEKNVCFACKQKLHKSGKK